MSFRFPKMRRAGFTVVEIMVVVVLIGLLLAVALPAFSKIRSASQNTRVANDLRMFRDALDTYYTTEGDYPAEVGPGVLPPEVAEWIREAKFTEATVIGGNYDYDNEANGFYVAVGINSPHVNDRQLRELDDKMDDGDLAAGVVQRLGDSVMLIVKE